MSFVDKVGAALWARGREGMAVVEGPLVTSANARLAALLDLDAGSIPGHRVDELVVVAPPAVAPGMADVIAGSSEGSIDVQSTAPGSKRILELSSTILDGAQVLLVFRDVTAERRRENELQQKRASLDDSINGYDIVDASGKLVYANQAYLDMWGYDSVDEVLGRSPAEHCADPDTAQRIIEALQEHGRTTLEFVGKRKDGSTFDVLMAAQLSTDENGEPVCVGTSLDISELKRLRGELLQMQKIQAIGTLAATVAHDLNNLLLPIMAYAEILQSDARLDAGQVADLKQIEHAAHRSKEVVTQLLSIGRRQMLEARPTELGAAVAELQSLIKRALREDVELTVEVSPRPCWVVVDPTQLQQILLNLVANAQDALPRGGRVTVEVCQRQLDAGRSHAGVEPTTGAFGEIVVSDDGEGMSSETVARVFEPFFTTKGRHGTGLGLATVQGIVEQHGGHIWVYSELGKGTTFKIYLPLTDAPPTSVPDAPPEERVVRGEVILIVEDNDLVRKATAAALIDAGYRAHAVESGAAALEWLADPEQRIDLLLTDVILADTDGKQLAEAVERVRPNTPVLYMSGYTDLIVTQRGILEADCDLLQKPFRASELVARVHRALSRARRDPG